MELLSSTAHQTADQLAARQASDWATLTSTPSVTSNRFAPLQSMGDDGEEDDPSVVAQTAFTGVKSKKTKRARDLSSQQPVPNRQNDKPTSERKAPAILGQSSFPGGKVAAARDIRKKAVFCVDNVSTSCTMEDIKSFVTKTLRIEVLSCYKAQPRRRWREETSVDDRNAFRLCICEKDRDRLLDANAWPTSVLISDWVFKKPNGNDKRLRMDIEASSAVTLSRSTSIAQDGNVLQGAEAASPSRSRQTSVDDDETVLELEIPQQ